MIVKETVNDRLVRHYSDQGLYIMQIETGVEYSEAIDVIPCRYTYEETDKPIEEIIENPTNEGGEML
jgi:hypothetical protein